MKHITMISIIVIITYIGYYIGYQNRVWTEIKRMSECEIFKDEVKK